jgi:hypothetical protein
MKRSSLAGALLACVAATGPGFGADMMVTKAPKLQAAAAAWTVSFNDELRYFSWHGSRGWPNNVLGAGSGSELYNPFGLSLSGAPSQDWKFDANVRGGLVWARQSLGGFSGELSTATDTTFSGTATYNGFNGFQPYVTLMVNAPTGTTNLQNTKTFARMDPDLVDIPTFGEGFNVGPTFGVNIPINQEFTLVLNGGYTWRGPWDKENGFDAATMTTPGPLQHTDPSRVYTGAATLTYVKGRLMVQGSGSIAGETTNFVDGMPQYRSGLRTQISGSTSYAWDEMWTSSIDGYFVHSDRNEIIMGNAPVLVAEAFDSNNNVYRVNFSHMYHTGPLTIGPVASFMVREQNSWDATTFQFVPGKTRFSVGGSGQYAVTNKITANARLEHVWIREDLSPDKVAIVAGVAQLFPGSGLPVVTGEGWTALGGLTAQLTP